MMKHIPDRNIAHAISYVEMTASEFTAFRLPGEAVNSVQTVKQIFLVNQSGSYVFIVFCCPSCQ